MKHGQVGLWQVSDAQRSDLPKPARNNSAAETLINLETGPLSSQLLITWFCTHMTRLLSPKVGFSASELQYVVNTDRK